MPPTRSGPDPGNMFATRACGGGAGSGSVLSPDPQPPVVLSPDTAMETRVRDERRRGPAASRAGRGQGRRCGAHRGPSCGWGRSLPSCSVLGVHPDRKWPPGALRPAVIAVIRASRGDVNSASDVSSATWRCSCRGVRTRATVAVAVGFAKTILFFHEDPKSSL